MRKLRPKHLLLAGVLCLGISAALLPFSGTSRGASTTVVGGTTYTCTDAYCEGQTVTADPSTMIDTAYSITLIDKAKTALCATTISGVTYFSNPAAYVGQNWYKGLAALTLAQSLSPDKATYDTAGNALMQTTITGKKYCANPAKWPSGMWAAAFSALATERSELVASPSKTGPTIR